MLLAVMLLYVGAVLCVNGIWLLGQARAAALAEPAPGSRGALGDTEAERRAARQRPQPGAEAQESVGGRGVEPLAAAAEAHPTFIQNREVAVLNIFTGFVGVAVSVTLLVQGNSRGDLSLIRGAGFILLFAFTYLWVAFNQFLNAGGRGFGWYCLFVAITAVPAGIYTLADSNGNTANSWLAINWFAWAVLWFVFFLLLALERPVARLAGALAIIEGIGTSWVFGFLLLEGRLHF